MEGKQTYFSYGGTCNGLARIHEVAGVAAEAWESGWDRWEEERERRYHGTLDHVLANVSSFSESHMSDVEVAMLDGSKLLLKSQVRRALAVAA